MAVIKKCLDAGAAADKINVGLPTYGRGFTLADPAQHGLYAPATGPSLMGNYVPEAGILGYSEICLNRWPETLDPEQQSPYAFQGNQWVGYDSRESLVIKVSNTLFLLSHTVQTIRSTRLATGYMKEF